MCSNPIPIRVSTAYLNRYINVPCGKCLDCLKNYQNNWLVRMYYECQEHSKMCFVTLTYNNNNIPTIIDKDTGLVHYSLYKPHIQKWLKRIRRRSEYHQLGLNFRYFLCGEYGPTTLRPHYHILFFGVNKLELAHALEDWEKLYGYTLAKDVQYYPDSLIKTCKYVSKYCSKGVFENPEVLAKSVEPPFRLASKGLGLSYVNKMKSHHLTGYLNKDYETMVQYRRVVLSDNKAYQMPRYYKEKIYGTKNLLSYRLLRQVEKMSDDLFASKLSQIQAQNPSWTYLQAFHALDLQTIADARCNNQRDFKQLANFYQRSKI